MHLGKKKKGITSRLKKLFTPWNRSNSKLEGDNNSNGIKSTKSTSDMLQAQRETQEWVARHLHASFLNLT